MVHHIILVKLKTSVKTEKVEELMIETRMRLLKIPEVRNLLCGKRIPVRPSTWDFFIGMDVETMAKLRVIEESAVYLQFRQQVLDPVTDELQPLHYEMDPGKDTRYS